MTAGRVALGIAVLAAVLFCLLDCGLGEKQTVPARIVGATYVAARYIPPSCRGSGRSRTCTRGDYEPEHFWARIESPLGSGSLDSYVLFKMAPNGRCRATFSRGRWTHRTWGPLSCSPEVGQW